MKKTEITVLVDYLINFYLFEPILKTFLAKGVTVHIACHTEHIEFIKGKIDTTNVKFIELNPIRKQYKFLYILHRFLQSNITPTDFSWQYHKKINMLAKTYGFKQSMLFRMSKFFPKVKGVSVSKTVQKMIFPLVKKVFPTDTIVVASLNQFPELLSSKFYKIYTITESWDHAVKSPNGYVSDTVFTWNQSLANDWAEYQGDKKVVATYPLKLRYSIENILKKNIYQPVKGERLKCVYAVASTAKYSVEKLVEVEGRIIEDICKATEKAGWDLLIKPRPISAVDEFETYRKRYPNVTIGYAKEGGAIPANYYLDDEYNATRFEEVLDCNLLINCFTTFGLDAAVAGIPVLQLDLRESDFYVDSNLFYENHHIKTYLANKKELLFHVKGQEIFSDKLAVYLNEDHSLAYEYSEHLRNWLIPKAELSTVLDNITEAILN